MTGSAKRFPGETLGFPQAGPGSLAPTGRRLAALLIDWLIAMGLASLAAKLGVFPGEAVATVTAGVWLVLGAVSARLFGFTSGQLVLGLQVVREDGGLPVGIIRLVLRGLLIFLVIPPLFTDADGRGLQDLVTRTAVVRR